MEVNIEKLRNELSIIKDRYKKKCEKLKTVTKSLNNFKAHLHATEYYHHNCQTELRILRKITSNLDRYVYEVVYRYKKQTFEDLI